MYGGGRLVEVMMQVMNLVMRSEPSQADGIGVYWSLSTKIVTMRE